MTDDTNTHDHAEQHRQLSDAAAVLLEDAIANAAGTARGPAAAHALLRSMAERDATATEYARFALNLASAATFAIVAELRDNLDNDEQAGPAARALATIRDHSTDDEHDDDGEHIRDWPNDNDDNG